MKTNCLPVTGLNWQDVLSLIRRATFVMAKAIVKLGKLLMISRKQRQVREGVVLFFINFLILAGLIFTMELFLICLGVGDIILPIPFLSNDLITKIIF